MLYCQYLSVLSLCKAFPHQLRTYWWKSLMVLPFSQDLEIWTATRINKIIVKRTTNTTHPHYTPFPLLLCSHSWDIWRKLIFTHQSCYSERQWTRNQKLWSLVQDVWAIFKENGQLSTDFIRFLLSMHLALMLLVYLSPKKWGLGFNILLTTAESRL